MEIDKTFSKDLESAIRHISNALNVGRYDALTRHSSLISAFMITTAINNLASVMSDQTTNLDDELEDYLDGEPIDNETIDNTIEDEEVGIEYNWYGPGLRG